jgi:NAD(P)H-hydrate epimerase
MHIYTSAQIRAWDAFTIAHEPIASIDLMERAAYAVAEWLLGQYGSEKQYIIFCGPGNNGGDGLAVARLLYRAGCSVQVYMLHSEKFTPDCAENLQRLQPLLQPIMVRVPADLPILPAGTIAVDALFGTGLARPMEGLAAEVVNLINGGEAEVVSIDMPSGLPADGLPQGRAIVQAHFTLSFQCPKLAFILEEAAAFVGRWHLLPIGLHTGYKPEHAAAYEWVDEPLMKDMLHLQRPVFAHKGHFGHAALLAGSPGMMGAAVMAASACVRSGAGLVTVGTAESEFAILHTAVPEAMCAPHGALVHEAFYERKTAIGAGPGWAADEYYRHLLQWLIHHVTVPLVLDATALYLLSESPAWLKARPAGSTTILTPHAGEFDRLFGACQTSLQRMHKAVGMAQEYKVIIVLKGAYTRIVTPSGLVYINSTGNPGMAKGGSGDVLCGLLTGLLAQHIPPVPACLAAVYLHGLAGNLAAAKYTQQAMTAMDMVGCLGEAWKEMLW